MLFCPLREPTSALPSFPHVFLSPRGRPNYHLLELVLAGHCFVGWSRADSSSQSPYWVMIYSLTWLCCRSIKLIILISPPHLGQIKAFDAFSGPTDVMHLLQAKRHLFGKYCDSKINDRRYECVSIFLILAF